WRNFRSTRQHETPLLRQLESLVRAACRQRARQKLDPAARIHRRKHARRDVHHGPRSGWRRFARIRKPRRGTKAGQSANALRREPPVPAQSRRRPPAGVRLEWQLNPCAEAPQLAAWEKDMLEDPIGWETLGSRYFRLKDFV